MKLMNVTIAVIIILLLLFVTGCGGEKKEVAAVDSEKLLPPSFSEFDLERVSDTRIFDNKGLWEYINGGAEIYLIYNFIDVSTADYKKDDVEIVVDMYRFKTSKDAYGLYTVFRPPDAEIIRLGVQGFMAPASLHFVKGEYFVQLTGDPEIPGGDLAIINLAEEISKNITGTTEKPAIYSDFPQENIVPLSDKYITEAFIGQKFLTEVFTQDYLIDKDSVTLFLTGDKMGSKYLAWSDFAEKVGQKIAAPDNLPYDEGYAFIIDDSYYGQMLVGLKGGRLAGIIGYNDGLKETAGKWLGTLK